MEKYGNLDKIDKVIVFLDNMRTLAILGMLASVSACLVIDGCLSPAHSKELTHNGCKNTSAMAEMKINAEEKVLLDKNQERITGGSLKKRTEELPLLKKCTMARFSEK